MQINEDHEVTLRREGTLGFLSGILIVAAAGMIRVCGAICRRDRAQVHKEGVTFVDNAFSSSAGWEVRAALDVQEEEHADVRQAGFSATWIAKNVSATRREGKTVRRVRNGPVSVHVFWHTK